MRMRLLSSLALIIGITKLLILASDVSAATGGVCAAGSDRFTINQVIPHLGYQFNYTAFSNDGDKYDKYDFTTCWEEPAPGLYKQTHNNRDGSQDYVLYQTAIDGLLCLENGFIIPEGGGNVEKTVAGNNIVFHEQAPGGAWQSFYTIADSYKSTADYKCTYQYAGPEEINVLGREIEAAKVLWQKECLKVEQSPYAGWSQTPCTVNGEDWYAQGLGLVKRKYQLSREGVPEQSGTVLLTSYSIP